MFDFLTDFFSHLYYVLMCLLQPITVETVLVDKDCFSIKGLQKVSEPV